MRVAFISDLHANLEALDAVLDDIEARAVDQTVCLGDVVDLGPAPEATVARLRERAISVVIGNHDPLDEPTGVPLLAKIQHWTREALSDDAREFLATRPTRFELEAHRMILLGVHASPRAVTEQILATTEADALEAMLDGARFDVLVGGHTHLPLVRRIAGPRVIVNVGSVGMPFETAFTGPPPRVLPYAEYGIIEITERGVSVELHRVAYDFAAFARSVHASGMPEPEHWLAQWLT